MRPGGAPGDPAPAPEAPLTLPSLAHAADHSVWDEPNAPPAPDSLETPIAVGSHERCSGCGYSLAGLSMVDVCPECALPIDLRRANYATWLTLRAGSITARDSWLITCAIALAAGPLAILTTIWGSMEIGDTLGILSAVGAAPPVEEIAKVGAPLMVIETRPWLFRTRSQIVVACLVSALTFSAVENVLYLRVYFPDADASLATWRWTVCVAMHVGCTAIASLGVCRVHRETFALRKRPRVEAAIPCVAIAILLHALYNGLAIALELTGVI